MQNGIPVLYLFFACLSMQENLPMAGSLFSVLIRILLLDWISSILCVSYCSINFCLLSLSVFEEINSNLWE